MRVQPRIVEDLGLVARIKEAIEPNLFTPPSASDKSRDELTPEQLKKFGIIVTEE